MLTQMPRFQVANKDDTFVSGMLFEDDSIHWDDGHVWIRRSAGFYSEYSVGEVWAGLSRDLPKCDTGTEWLFYFKHEAKTCAIYKLHACSAASKASSRGPPPRPAAEAVPGEIAPTPPWRARRNNP